MPRSRRARTSTRCEIAMAFAGLWLATGCSERIGESTYDRCRSSAQCYAGRSCVEVRSPGGDAGDQRIGVCTLPCTVSSLASSVYFVAGGLGDVCVGIDSSGNIDSTQYGVSGWYLRACGTDHYDAGREGAAAICTPFDYAAVRRWYDEV